MIVFQLILFCLLFIGMVKFGVRDGAINGIYFYPKPVQERAVAIGLTDWATVRRKKRGLLTVIWIAGAALAVGLAVLIFEKENGYVQTGIRISRENHVPHLPGQGDIQALEHRPN